METDKLVTIALGQQGFILRENYEWQEYVYIAPTADVVNAQAGRLQPIGDAE